MVSIIIVLVIVSVVLKNVLQEKYTYTDDINKFKIFSGKLMPMIFDGSAIFWFLIAFAASFTENPDDKYMWISFFIIGVLSAIGSIAVRKKIYVSGNDIVCQTLGFNKKQYTFNDIEYVWVLDGGAVIAMGKTGKLFSFDMDFLGSDNFIRRCEKEQKKITSKGGKPLTKKDFLKSKMTLVMMLIFSVLSLVMFGPTSIARGQYMDIVGFVLVIGVGVPAVLYILMVPKTYFFISRMEKVLGFDFDKVMAAAEIGRIPYIDQNWFINGEHIEKVVINRKFVSSIKEMTPGEAGNVNVVIITADNRKKKYIMQGGTAGDFEDWFYGRVHDYNSSLEDRIIRSAHTTSNEEKNTNNSEEK